MQPCPLQNISTEENLEEDNDPLLQYNRSPHVEPFHRQGRIDGTLPFNEQLTNMQHIVSTNGIDGRATTISEVIETTEIGQGGIWKETIHSGIGQRPSAGANVRLHYYAYFEHRDEPFDSSFKRRHSLEFRLGKCEILPGIDLAVGTMQRRERAKFIISSDLLYGELGCTPHIPESAWCLYVIELLSTNEPGTIIHDDQLTLKVTDKHQVDDFAKRIRLAQTLRNTGNEEYANGHLDRALRSYNKARQLIHNRVTLIDGKSEEQYHQLLLKLHLNSAQCYLRLDNYERCFRACRDALIIEPNNLKALFRASISLRLLNQFDQAEKYLSKAIQIDGNNRDILIEAAKLYDARKSAPQLVDSPSKTVSIDIDDLNNLLSSIDVSEEFRANIQTLLNQSSPISTENFSQTELYYVELVNLRTNLQKQ